MAFCSSCGSQLIDGAKFCSQCGVIADAPRVAVDPPERLGAERVLYQGPAGALVSTTRAVLAGVTYPIASISSVRVITIAMSCWGPVLILAGVITVIVGFTNNLQTQPLVIGAAMLALGLTIALTKRERAIILVTTGGETTALKSTDYETIDSIINALNEAIVERG